MTYTDPGSTFGNDKRWHACRFRGLGQCCWRCDDSRYQCLINSARSIGRSQPKSSHYLRPGFRLYRTQGLADFMHMRVSMEKHIICCIVKLHTQPVLASTNMQPVSCSFLTLRHGTDDSLVAASPPSRKPGSFPMTKFKCWD